MRSCYELAFTTTFRNMHIRHIPTKIQYQYISVELLCISILYSYKQSNMNELKEEEEDIDIEWNSIIDKTHKAAREATGKKKEISPWNRLKNLE